MFLTKVGLLQKERKQSDARLSAAGPGTRGLATEVGASPAPGLCSASKEDPPCHLWWPSLLVLVLVDGPDGSLDVLHAHEALVQAQVVADGVLRAERAGELSGTAPAPPPGPLPLPPHPPPRPAPAGPHSSRLSWPPSACLQPNVLQCHPISAARVQALSPKLRMGHDPVSWTPGRCRGRWGQRGTRDQSHQQGAGSTATLSAAAHPATLSKAS